MLIKKNKRERHFGSLSEHAIRNEERCKPLTERVEVRQYTRRLLTSFREAASSVPHKQAHKQRALCCSLCFTRKLRELKVAE